ncbi:hypothetical protein CCMSSC00406_0006332 [Pleurotus cornucopiae]|uniref:Uncharacterized protein n=1 Tax=Pleurotus cornucopiae TaxID=5321 RepID=A0ACB7IPT8_PLECO|nr:hypothetical protein CCMSSC00406_0006332 [Pleurotus cornucopiae]
MRRPCKSQKFQAGIDKPRRNEHGNNKTNRRTAWLATTGSTGLQGRGIGGSARQSPSELENPNSTGRSRSQPSPPGEGRDNQGATPPRPQQQNTLEEPQTRKKKQRRAKAGITVASLNIKGYGQQHDNVPQKWTHINQIMRDKKLAILAVQETHMDEARCEAIQSIFGRRLHIVASADEESPSQKAGVAIVMNKCHVDTSTETTTVIVSGQAILSTIGWGGKKTLTILAVYAPNQPGENAGFWRKINDFFANHPRTKKPDIMLGDFNMVEDAIDRNPAHNDSPRQVQELAELKTDLRLRDGWRHTRPDQRSYTFMQPVANGGAKSRIDRIYVTEQLLQKSNEWQINHSGLANTDHWMVSTRVTNAEAPHQGDGRWCIPERVIEDRAFRNKAKELIGSAWREIVEGKNSPRTEQSNPQKTYTKLKHDILENARRRDKTLTPKIIRDIATLRRDLHAVDGSQDPSQRITARLIADKIADLEKKKHNKVRSLGKVKNRLEGETNSRYWMQINKELKPRDMIYSLKDPNTPGNAAETVSKKMAELARKYHDELQLSGRDDRDDLERETVTREALEKVKARPTGQQQRELSRAMTPEEISQAIRLSDNNSAPGIDGVTNLLWKRLIKDDAEPEEGGQANERIPTIIKILTEAFNDIEDHGLAANSRFAEGWMCPIYKKNDKDDIANYRPITLLNTDYKILTKALSIRLAAVAGTLLHESQAGFVKGRKIVDQTHLIKMVINYAEAKEENGIIVALDQEKAYDKIEHDYLWRTLKKFQIPDKFIRVVKSLYQNAETKVMVNGHLSTAFRVTRGVRQGGPLSCLLFDLAIEPLSIALRESDLRGIDIPGLQEKLKAVLFADDTTVFLNETDEFESLEEILNTWCKASGAKFNIRKTQVLPIGRKDYREHFVQHRKSERQRTRIPEGIQIVKEGETIRMLGAWMGNEGNELSPWAPIMESIDNDLSRWDKSRPSLEGRKLITQFVVGGRTQYLTQVQGMPTSIEELLQKQIRTFVWGEKKTPVKEETLYAPRAVGGKGLLDIRARNEAIEIMKLKSYLQLDEKRPTWTRFADGILAGNVPKSMDKIPEEVRLNCFLQSWKSSRGKGGNKNPAELSKMLKTARKYGTRIETRGVSKDTARQMPIWYHAETTPGSSPRTNTKTTECLRTKHQIRTVGEMADMEAKGHIQNHKPRRNCRCHHCKNMRDNEGCENPHACYKKADEILRTLPDEWEPRKINVPPGQNEDNREEWTSFHGNDTVTKQVKNIFRIFTEGAKSQTAQHERAENGETVRVATDGSCKNANTTDARAGAGVFIAANDERNKSLRVPEELPQTNQVGELLAALEAIRLFPGEEKLEIITDSRYVIKSLTTNLEANEDRGYIGTANRDLIKQTIEALRARQGRTSFKWVKGHQGDYMNEGADLLAGQGCDKDYPRQGNQEVNPDGRLSGARLQSLNQAMAYKGIQEAKLTNAKHRRERTKTVIAMIQDHMMDSTRAAPNESQIWEAAKNKDLSRQIRFFLWMSIHDAYKIGKYWTTTIGGEYTERGLCRHCNDTTEDMPHILTQCESPGQSEIWQLADWLWTRKGYQWRQPWIGDILACGAKMIKDKDGTTQHGDMRFWRILIAESAYLIWKIRCARVIQGENQPVSQTEVQNKWRSTMNERLDLDRKMTHKRYGKRALKASTVLKTWKGVLLDENKLPKNWIDSSGVLVGSDLQADQDNR